MNKYFKNFILCGDIDHHCLLCKESFQTIEDLEKHIRWEKHRKIIKDMVAVPKFKKDTIFKLDTNYYCEVCNLLIPTLTDVPEHIKNPKHKDNKVKPGEAKGSICKREANMVVIGQIKLTNREWNGIVNGNCILCSTAVDNTAKHIGLPGHVINLINSEIDVKDGQYYRKINDETIYCFPCKKTIPTSTVADHQEDDEHVKLFKAKTGVKEPDSISDLNKKIEINKKLIKTQAEFFDIDLVNKVAMCKICTGYVNINFKYMLEHKRTHDWTKQDRIKTAKEVDVIMESLKARSRSKGRKRRIFDHGKTRSELAKFGRENFIKLIPPGAKGYCFLCNISISAHMTNFTAHLQGRRHMGNLEVRGLSKSIKLHIKHSFRTRPFCAFVKSVIHAEEFKVLFINKTYCIDIFSYLLVDHIREIRYAKKMKCFACDIIFDQNQISDHCGSDKHKENFASPKIITNLESEFIREIRPNLFHCGLCNIAFPYWETIDKHLLSWKHTFIRNDKEIICRLAFKWYEHQSGNLNIWDGLLSQLDKLSLD